MADTRTKVVISVDTEPSVAGAITYPDKRRPLIDEPVMGMVRERSHALGFVLETLRRYGHTATFFVETAHVRAFGEGPMRTYVEAILNAGHDIQLHLHPVWTSWRNGRYDPAWRSTDSCASLPSDQLTELMAEGKAMLERWTGRAVVAARAGNFSSSTTVVEASAKAGLPLTSHVNIARCPPAEPELRRAGGAISVAGAREFPATCFRRKLLPGRPARWSPFNITAASADELIAMLRSLHAASSPIAMIVMHPFDFLKRRNVQFQGMRPNLMVQRRLERLARFLADNSHRFAVHSFPQAASALPGDVPAPSLAASPLLALLGKGSNWVNDRFR